MPTELALIDTNVIVYSCYQDSPHHGPARRLIEQAQQQDAGLCVAPQVLAEFYAIVTD